MASRTVGLIRPILGSPGPPAGMPICTTRTSPAWSLPGAIHRPGLAAWNVAVASALTAAPSTSPVEPLTPLGTSQATTTGLPASPSPPPAAFMASIAPAAGSRGSPAKPVPRIASTIAPAPSSACGENRCGRSPGSRFRLWAASPRSSSGSESVSTRTSRPCSRSRRAATRPSPPLFPLPQTTATAPDGERSATSAARPPPARSMRSRLGMPRSEIAHSSSARCSAASGSGSSQSASAVRIADPRLSSHASGTATRVLDVPVICGRRAGSTVPRSGQSATREVR